MEDYFEGENQNNEDKGSIEDQQGSKPKRKMKTPFQLETLEKAYALDKHPSEATRAELSEKLGLTDRQLQMWFCHRRLKDKKDTPVRSSHKGQSLPTSVSPMAEMRGLRHEPASDYLSGSVSGSSPFTEKRPGLDDFSVKKMYFESSPKSVMELRAIACVEAQLGEPIREDGPILGMEFDPLPPDAFGAPIAAAQQKWAGYPHNVKGNEQRGAESSIPATRAIHEYQFLQDQLRTRSNSHSQVCRLPYLQLSVEHVRGTASPFVHEDGIHCMQAQLPQPEKKERLMLSPGRGEDGFTLRETFTNTTVNVPSVSLLIMEPQNPDVFPNMPKFHNDTEVQVERKQKSEAKLAREVEAHESRLGKEPEKQEILRRKSEERLKKEMEKLDRERRREEERLIREKQREEERFLREQRRQLERREKLLQKEYLRAEKLRQKEELRREKEALKRKAVMEKAAAKRIAKESMDLIEDEQLELMELAAVSKGLPSIVQHDHNNLQNLDGFRDSLTVFPHKSVKLKKPFAFLPWRDSEENVGNLLMVWRFFITFADVLGLWPFTLNEFVQAFHDYESRLLTEIHISLLKLIIKDIEDVARTPSTGFGAQQYFATNPEGGHLQIVEGAYSWGFDIRNWQQHLSPLTWHEIFRQLALAAGLGPQLKKRSPTWTHLGTGDEVKGCEELISTIRDGSAAENAFALMREKGLLLPRRSRHRLTPGTVKFAAFHVLSLEGSKGLTVLELAVKIQKSGLRDLTTSKTPEASISVALTRDQKLFERIAPSTYCVRAAYSKDPADAEAVLSAARKKIKQFENGLLGGDDVDDIERDEEYDGDGDGDAEIDYLAIPMFPCEGADLSMEASRGTVITKENACCNDQFVGQSEVEKKQSDFTLRSPNDAKTVSGIEQHISREDEGPRNADKGNLEIDERNPGESWIQGLTEGEYSHLSVEERIKALVVLVGIANEGNSMRIALEDRLEAANALKKQMWEAQLDRSRIKEDILRKVDFTSFTGIKSETQVTSSAVEGIHLPSNCMKIDDDENPKALLTGRESGQNCINSLATEKSLAVQDFTNYADHISNQQQGYASKRSRSKLKAYIGHLAEEMYIYRSLPLGQDRRHNRYWQFVASTSSEDPSSGRIFVELRDGRWRVIDCEEAFDALLASLDSRGVRESHLRLMLQEIERSFKENVKRNLCNEDLASLSGIENEDAEAYYNLICSASADRPVPSSMGCASNMDKSDTFASFRIELGRNDSENKVALKRYQDFQKWMWKECFDSFTLCALKHGKKRCPELLSTCEMCLESYVSEYMHCSYCHRTFHTADRNFNFAEHRVQCEGRKSLEGRDVYTCDHSPSIGIKLLKAVLAVVEASIPVEAMELFWHRNLRASWGMKLNLSSSTEELLQVLTVLESAIKQDYLSPSFELTKELLSSSFSLEGAEYELLDLGSVPILSWLPKTTAAVALRLLELDAAIIYAEQEKPELCVDKSVKVFMLPSRNSPQIDSAKRNSPQIGEAADTKELKRDGFMEEDNFIDLRGRHSSNKRGQSNNGQRHVTKVQNRSRGLKSVTGSRNARDIENSNEQLRQQVIRANIPASGRGRRTFRKRRENTVNEETLLGHINNTVGRSSYHGSVRNLSHEWVLDQAREDGLPDNSNDMEAVEPDGNTEPDEYEQGMGEQTSNDGPDRWNANSREVSDDGRYDSRYGNGIEQEIDEDSEGDIEVSDDSNGLANTITNDGDTYFAESEDFSD